jgi:hypothetical protein
VTISLSQTEYNVNGIIFTEEIKQRTHLNKVITKTDITKTSETPNLKGCEDMYKKQGLELSWNNNSFIKFIFKHVINALALSKVTETVHRRETEARTLKNKKGKMAEPLTNVILTSILHLIR